jgi:C_GCAxxG_C_C family probable redox protein
MEDKNLQARNSAGNNFKSGLNCAESVVHTFNELLGTPIQADAVKMASGFGGGLGHAGCICGALTGSVMVLGMLKGRTDSTQDRLPVYELAREFHDRFQTQFGATCCRSLNQYEFDSPEHLRNCLKLTGGTAKLLMEFLTEKDLII